MPSSLPILKRGVGQLLNETAARRRYLPSSLKRLRKQLSEPGSIAMSKIPKKAQQRFVKTLPVFQRVLEDARRRDINEADTVTIVTDMLADLFGFDKYTEITGEFAVRKTFCDLAIKFDSEVKLLIEVKAIGLSLKENHLRQAVNYGANQGIQWVVLTNGIEWEVYALKFEKPISYNLLCKFSLTEMSARSEDDQSILLLLSKEGLLRNLIREYQDRANILNKFTLAAVIQSEPVLGVMRRELRRINPDLKVDTDELEEILLTEVLKRDLIEGERMKKATAKVKKASDRALRRIPKKTAQVEDMEPELA